LIRAVLHGLLGGEEALLGLGYFMEPSRGFFIRLAA